MAAAEAFDPFADDDDFASTPTRRSEAPPVIAPRRGAPRGSPRDTPRGSSRRGSKSKSSDGQTADIMKEFGAAFPTMSLEDPNAMDQFGFPSNVFPATFDQQGADDVKVSAKTTTKSDKSATSSLEGVTFVMAEEMSVIHKSQTNQCSVKVRGNISLEEAKHNRTLSCDLTIHDPNQCIETSTSKNYDYVQPFNDNSFRLSMPELNGKNDNWFGCPLIEYTCGEKLRPVPMLINTNVQEYEDRCQIMFQLRVNPRNASSLLNAVVLVCVPEDFDGGNAQVSSVGRSIGKGKIDTNWSGITRILSWRLGELYSGAICEFEALFPPSYSEPKHEQTEPKFPVLLRYDSEGSLLSGVDVEFGEGKPTMKRKYRVYHREV